jgi:hypothetical protein
LNLLQRRNLLFRQLGQRKYDPRTLGSQRPPVFHELEGRLDYLRDSGDQVINLILSWLSCLTVVTQVADICKVLDETPVGERDYIGLL